MFLRLRRFLTSSSISDVHLERLTGPDAGLAVLTLQRPASKNALGRDMLQGLRDAIKQVQTDKSLRCLVVCSSVDRVFCPGADLKERATMPQEEVPLFVNKLRDTFTLLENLEVPTVAALEGAAVGGGLELALSCDLRVASPEAVLALTETSLAIIPGAGGTQRLPRVVGPSVAKELIFTARRVRGVEALQLGLVNRLAGTGEALKVAMELAREILPQGPVALRAAKAAINAGMQTDISTGLLIEQANYARVIPTKDRMEGLTAFREKRKPVYTGE